MILDKRVRKAQEAKRKELDARLRKLAFYYRGVYLSRLGQGFAARWYVFREGKRGYLVPAGFGSSPFFTPLIKKIDRSLDNAASHQAEGASTPSQTQGPGKAEVQAGEARR